MIHVIDPGYPGWMWWIFGSIVVMGIFVLVAGISLELDGLTAIGASLVIVGSVFGLLGTATVYDSNYASAVETAITLEGYSNVSYDGESTFTAASPTGEYFSGYLAPVGDDTFKIVEIPS